MAASRTAAARSGAQRGLRAAPARGPQARPQRLEVVSQDPRVRAVGAMGSVVALIVFVSLFAIAGLHAILVQTQAEVDAVHAANAQLEEYRNRLVAELAWYDSPEGLEDMAISVGLVPAADFVMLAPVADGALLPPPSADPFARGAAAQLVSGGDG